MTTPRKLQTAIKQYRTQHRIADALQVNAYYVNRYLKHGEEPTNPQIRKKMGFPPLRKKHDGRSGFTELPPHVQWWRKLPKQKRDEWIQKAHNVDQKYRTDDTQGEYRT